MAIDLGKALGHELPRVITEYNEDQVILYHLGLGAGVPPTDPKEIEYTYEGRLKVLPTFGLIPAYPSLYGLPDVPGLEYDPVMLLHAEQEVELHKPLPVRQKVESSARIAELWDKGRAAVVVLETVVNDEQGDKLCTSRVTLFLRGAGGFGGMPGPSRRAVVPEREPDRVLESQTLAQGALLHRLCGDKNPLHADPDVAKVAGFERPILHGLCSYGMVCKAVVDTVLGGDVTKVARYQARFAGIVFPGETLLTSLWRDGDEIVLETKTKERDSDVLTMASITVRS